MGIQINGNTNNINAGIGSLSIEDINELDIVGVATAANFKTGVSNLHSLGLTLSGGQLDVGSNIKIGTAGVITATSFVGSGANLTGITQTTINNNANNRLITGSGTANTLEGEANLTFDGDSLLLLSSTDGRRVSFAGGGTSHYMKFDNTLNGIILNGYGGITFETNGTNERVRIDSSGRVGIGINNPLKQLHVYKSNEHPVMFERGDTSNTIVELKTNGATRGYWGCSTTANFMVYDNDASDIKFTVKQDGEVNFASDAVFTNSSWSGNKAGKIQHHSNWLYLQAGTSGIKLRSSNGSDETLFSGRKIDIEGGRNSSDDALVVHMEDNRYRKIQLAEATVSHAVGTYGGFIGYDASNNYMTLGTNQAGTVHEGMRFHRSGGYVTKPTQPKFSAYMANTYSWNNQIIVWDSEMYDVGNHYNTSNGKFTAPVAGYYVFGVKFRANGGFSQFGGMWTKNSSTYKRAFGQNSYAQGDCITAVDVIPMSANDTMGLRFEGSHGGATGGAHENGFWGYLLG